ncbi:MAG: AraC family transcriptional regulator [Chloroflexi bacterium]|nr:AraC family transcriptional regulator [Chloroflexota bacterium]
MPASLVASAHAGLERSCGDWVRSRGPVGGVELLQAWFNERAFSPHRHDTYGIGVTDAGVQTFEYRGAVERSLPGQVAVLHPDEKHDGRPGTADGFGYHIVYVAPELIARALRDVVGRPTPLPFLREPVLASEQLARAVSSAFESDLEPLARDTLVVRLAEGLLCGDASLPKASVPCLDQRGLARARDCLDSTSSVVRSSVLERVSGLSRYALSRQFRALYGTSPYRYSLLRRLDFARERLRSDDQLADVALAAGFADQAHFTRMFKAAYGMPPQRYRTLQSCARWS